MLNRPCKTKFFWHILFIYSCKKVKKFSQSLLVHLEEVPGLSCNKNQYENSPASKTKQKCISEVNQGAKIKIFVIFLRVTTSEFVMICEGGQFLGWHWHRDWQVYVEGAFFQNIHLLFVIKVPLDPASSNNILILFVLFCCRRPSCFLYLITPNRVWRIGHKAPKHGRKCLSWLSLIWGCLS